MRDAEKETLLEERDRQEENKDALLRATGRLLERLALVLTGAGIVSLMLAAKGVDPGLLTGAAVLFVSAAICTWAGGWIGGMADG